MSLDSYTRTITDVAQQVYVAPKGVGRVKVYLSNLSQTDDVYIGDENVTSGTGLLLHKNASNAGNRIELELFSNDVLYAVCSAGKTAPLVVFVSGLN